MHILEPFQTLSHLSRLKVTVTLLVEWFLLLQLLTLLLCQGGATPFVASHHLLGSSKLYLQSIWAHDVIAIVHIVKSTNLKKPTKNGQSKTGELVSSRQYRNIEEEDQNQIGEEWPTKSWWPGFQSWLGTGSSWQQSSHSFPRYSR